jgi:hypothetical protein
MLGARGGPKTETARRTSGRAASRRRLGLTVHSLEEWATRLRVPITAETRPRKSSKQQRRTPQSSGRHGDNDQGAQRFEQAHDALLLCGHLGNWAVAFAYSRIVPSLEKKQPGSGPG